LTNQPQVHNRFPKRRKKNKKKKPNPGKKIEHINIDLSEKPKNIKIKKLQIRETKQ